MERMELRANFGAKIINFVLITKYSAYKIKEA